MKNGVAKNRLVWILLLFLLAASALPGCGGRREEPAPPEAPDHGNEEPAYGNGAPDPSPGPQPENGPPRDPGGLVFFREGDLLAREMEDAVEGRILYAVYDELTGERIAEVPWLPQHEKRPLLRQMGPDQYLITNQFRYNQWSQQVTSLLADRYVLDASVGPDNVAVLSPRTDAAGTVDLLLLDSGGQVMGTLDRFLFPFFFEESRLYVDHIYDGRIVYDGILEADRAAIFLVDPHTRDRSLLLQEALNPVVSPDGTMMVYLNIDPARDIGLWLFDLEQRKDVTRLEGSNKMFFTDRGLYLWSPEGDALNFTEIPYTGREESYPINLLPAAVIEGDPPRVRGYYLQDNRYYPLEMELE